MDRNKLKGFTLIELVMTIVIISILAAMAIPQFISLSANAEQSVVSGLVGAISSAQNIFKMKMITCNQDYPTVNNATLGFFIKLSGPVEQMNCAGPWHTIAIDNTIQKIAKDPSQNVLINERTIQINTKTNHLVTITQDPVTNNITWSTTPSY